MRYGWSLKEDQWKTLSKAVSGRTWSRTYLESDYTDRVPTSSGVYLICAGTKNIPISGEVMDLLYNTIYVGQASNLQKRFRDHVKGYGNVVPAKDAFRRLDFWYSTIERTQLTDIEQLLLTSFGPTANLKNAKHLMARIGNPVPAGRITGA